MDLNSVIMSICHSLYCKYYINNEQFKNHAIAWVYFVSVAAV